MIRAVGESTGQLTCRPPGPLSSFAHPLLADDLSLSPCAAARGRYRADADDAHDDYDITRDAFMKAVVLVGVPFSWSSKRARHSPPPCATSI